jgi:hypothetical protein
MDKVIDKLPNTINNTNAHRKGNKMVTSNSDDFEIINADDISFVKRGRKASVNPALVEALKTLANGKAMALKSLKVEQVFRVWKEEQSKDSDEHLKNTS